MPTPPQHRPALSSFLAWCAASFNKILSIVLGDVQATAYSGVWPPHLSSYRLGWRTLLSVSYGCISRPLSFKKPGFPKHHGKTQDFCNCFCKMTYFCLLIIGRCHPSFWNYLPFLKFPALLLLNLLLEPINSSSVSIKYLRTSEADSNTDCLAPQPGGIAWLSVVRIFLRGVRGGRRLGNIYLLPLFKRP